MPQITVKVDHFACAGIGSCVEVSSKFFRLDGENRAVVISNVTGDAEAAQTLEVSDAEAKEILQAAESCPMIAVSILADNGAQIYG